MVLTHNHQGGNLMSNVSKRVYIKSFGCPTNLSDGEIIAGCLSQAGFSISKETHSADILIYNTCAVKTPTENRIIDVLKKTPKDKRVIITGCLPLINFERIRNELWREPGRKVKVIRTPEEGYNISFFLNTEMVKSKEQRDALIFYWTDFATHMRQILTDGKMVINKFVRNRAESCRLK